jgi:hypothetical protein
METKEHKIYIYKMTTDNGGAPCVWHNTLSLAICKPVIRRKAQKDDIIFGFGGKKYEERLLYIAVVTDKPRAGCYYCQDRYKNRPDCIYKKLPDGKADWKKQARFHLNSKELHTDVGEKFDKAHVLLSTDFRYFGKKGTHNYKENYETIKEIVEKMGRGSRVNHDVELRKDLMRLKDELWTNPILKQGNPSSSDRAKVCNKAEAMKICKER